MGTSRMKKIDSPIWHILFWAFYWLLYLVMYDYEDRRLIDTAIIVGVEFPIKLITAYFLSSHLLPHYMKHKNYKYFIGMFLASMVVFIYIQGTLVQNITYPMFWPMKKGMAYWGLVKVIKLMVGIYGVAATFVAIRFTFQNLERQQREQQLQKEKLSTELRFLKGQVNPHFLFNTLNNLYSLILKKRPGAKEVVLKLSELMSYMLHEASDPLVPLGKEIQYIKNYVDLEKIRFDERFDVSINALGEVNTTMVPPLIILPFIENSFKHGVDDEIDKAWITVDISVVDQVFTLKVENSKSLKNNHKPSGIGLQNIRKRLDLIFGEFYNLKISDEEMSYRIILKCELNHMNAYS